MVRRGWFGKGRVEALPAGKRAADGLTAKVGNPHRHGGGLIPFLRPLRLIGGCQ